MASTGKKEVINFKVDGKLFQSDGALYLNHMQTISLWIFGTVKNGQAICLRGHEDVYCMCKIHPKPNTAANKG